MRIVKTVLTLTFIITFLTFGFCQKPELTFQKVVVLEVQQVNSYTYLYVKENDNERWLAIPSMDAKIGEVYYYKGGMEMTDFNSKELNKTFESVIFLASINKNPIDDEKTVFQHASNIDSTKTSNSTVEKLTLVIKPVDGGISIAELIKNKKSYESKTVRIKGKVTKFNPQVMRKNWVHLQDGTEYNGIFDLTLTTNAEVKVGDIVTLEGELFLDRDFGYGYFYNLIVENAILLK
jgi:hypothetical protein